MWIDKVQTRRDKLTGERPLRRQETRSRWRQLKQQDIKVTLRRKAWKIARNQCIDSAIDIENMAVEDYLNDNTTEPCVAN
mgnify:CR=1 FL=1